MRITNTCDGSVATRRPRNRLNDRLRVWWIHSTRKPLMKTTNTMVANEARCVEITASFRIKLLADKSFQRIGRGPYRDRRVTPLAEGQVRPEVQKQPRDRLPVRELQRMSPVRPRARGRPVPLVAAIVQQRVADVD